MRSERRKSWLLERAALKELPRQLSEQSQRHLQDEATPQALAELEQDTRAFWSNPRALRTLSEVRRGVEKQPTRWQPVAALAVACCALLLIVGNQSFTKQGTQDENRIKGLQPHLVIYRATQSGRVRLRDGVSAHAGDVLQVGYVAAGERYGAILSVDGSGHVTLLTPSSATETPSLKPSGEVLLPFGYRLDSAPEFERFFLITSKEPFSVAGVLQKTESFSAQLKGGSGLPWPREQTSTFVVHKENP